MITGLNYLRDNRPITTEGNRSSFNAVFSWLASSESFKIMDVPSVADLAFHPISKLITSANGQDVNYIFVGSGGEFFWGLVLVLSGMYLHWFVLYRREKFLMVGITLAGEVWLCGVYVACFGWPDGPELTGSNCGPDMERTRTKKGLRISP